MLRHCPQSMIDKDLFIEKLLQIKRARLIEHNLSYEELKMMDNFSDDEKTYDFDYNEKREVKPLKALRRARKLRNQLINL